MGTGAFLQMIQSRTARVAVGPSTVRGRGNKGVAEAARGALRVIDLAAFGTPDTVAFALALDKSTERVRVALPVGAQHWGIARKVLNIFLRDALYTRYLSDTFNLECAEKLFELPLDSYTAKRLFALAPRGSLPRWCGVKYLTAPISEAFQAAALRQAEAEGIARVHLDARWWSSDRRQSVISGITRT